MSPVSGTVPYFDLSTCPDPGGVTVASCDGAISGVASATHSSEPLQYFYRRAVGILSLSGVLSASGATSGMQCFSGGVVSGLRALQQECAMRAADIERPDGAASRLRLTNSILTASGQFQLGGE